MERSKKKLKNVFVKINDMASRINLSKPIIDKAYDIFIQVHREKNLRGRRTDAIMAGCLYFACRQEKVPHTFGEIQSVSKVNKKEISRTYISIVRELETTIGLLTAGDYVSRLCSRLNLPATVQKAAKYIVNIIEENDYGFGRWPVSIAAVAIYMASQASEDKRSLKEIAEISTIAYTTITTLHKLLIPYSVKLFPADFKFATPIHEFPQIRKYY